LRTTPPEREQVKLSRVGLHWEALDEDISIAGLLAGRGDVRMSRLDALAEEALVAHRAGRSRNFVRHFASPKFRAAYEALPLPVRKLADANFGLLKRDPRHPDAY
jgi:hypothetical protein